MYNKARVLWLKGRTAVAFFCAALMLTAFPASAVRVVIVPGMGAVSVDHVFWYSSLKQRLNTDFPGINVVLRNMPDPFMAPASTWLPFLEDTLRVGPDTIVVGHSSGALAAMRYAETHRVAGLILVAAYSNDLGNSHEARSGYFDTPWDWAAIRANAGFIIQLGSRDDLLVPFAAQQEAADALGSTFYRFDDKGHFLSTSQPELVDIVEAKLGELAKGN
ncbi:retinoblastoma binding protein 9 [Monoraphidium neglectum]|uniref:Retinoblastoma binding protein 9 n=1 Tax=Monoraphidium neglectum TaxID=145388 RepID=A0A0D2K6L0_9CHLO|nr:retinoblastoma binding protein 9 [Monoraphidium neglectum]KIZ05968.1 retinoblastoma binding protein 9 [Monoraphidium neglectum]|eukprot:XP_013904987.1 retinoblastoma binding protein 9 [Monoraphidium neglectum]